MQHIHNISITAPAERFLRQQMARTRLREGDIWSLGFISRFVNADGSTVDRFVPGYMVEAWPRASLTERYLVAHLPDETVFYFLPKFNWSASERYVVDLDGFMFSIGPV